MHLATIASIFLLQVTAASAEPIAGSLFYSGNWEGAAYTDDTTGQFSHCSVSAGYDGGDMLMFAHFPEGPVTIAIESPSLRAPVGATFPVALYVDRLRPFLGNAEVLTPTLAAVSLPDTPVALEALKRGRTLWIETNLGTREFDLEGTHRALDALQGCGRWYNGYVAQQPAAPGTPAPLTTAVVPLVDHSVLYQVATEMIGQLEVEGFRYLSEAEAQRLFSADSVWWTAEDQGITGGVLAIPFEGVSELRETDGGDIGFLAGLCSGELATTTRDVSVPGYPGREVRTLCVDGTHETETYLTKVLIEGWVFYTVLEFDGEGSRTAPQSRRSVSEDVAIRAASYVSDAIE